MTAYVVDTNVCMVANGETAQADLPCRQACISILRRIQQHGLLVMDSNGYIFEEYKRRLSLKGQPGVGDMFFKWMFNNRYKENLVTMVNLTKTDDEFDAFPDDPRLAQFDNDDRMFAAAAVAYDGRGRARVQNAVDRDWWEHRDTLEENSVTVDFLCGTKIFARTKKRKRL